MAGIAEIALVIKANVRDAVRGIEQVDKAIERTDKRIRTISERTRSRLGRGAEAGIDLLSGASPESVIAQAVPQAGMAYIAFEASKLAAKVYHDKINQAVAQANKDLALADTGQEAGAAFAAGVRREGTRGGSVKGLRIIGQVLTGKAPPRALGPGGWSTRDETRRIARSQFRTQAKADPYLAADIIANLPPDLAWLRPDLQAILAQEQAAATAQQKASEYRASLRSNATVVNQTTNVYSSFAGFGGESAVGREVRSVLDRRDRNNGRYVTTWTRRG